MLLREIDQPVGRFNSQINLILDNLRHHPEAHRFYVVGSVATGQTRPGDLDIVVDRRDTPYSRDVMRRYDDLLVLSQWRRTGVEGLLDPFVWFADVLAVRTDDATGWQKAKNARSLKAEFRTTMVALSRIENLPTAPL